MSDQTIDRTKLPIRRPPFQGVLSQTLDGTQPDWEQIGHAKAPTGAPNVLVVLIDDAGFGNPSTFGGPIDTPNFDRMADQGLRYNLGRKGAKLGGGVGLVVGLFAPPLLAATAVGAAGGAVLGKLAKHRLESGIAEKMDAALPPSSGGVIAVYDADGADAVDKALANAVKKSVAQIDGLSAKELKAGLAEAQAGMGG